MHILSQWWGSTLKISSNSYNEPTLNSVSKKLRLQATLNTQSALVLNDIHVLCLPQHVVWKMIYSPSSYKSLECKRQSKKKHNIYTKVLKMKTKNRNVSVSSASCLIPHMMQWQKVTLAQSGTHNGLTCGQSSTVHTLGCSTSHKYPPRICVGTTSSECHDVTQSSYIVPPCRNASHQRRQLISL